MFEDIKQAGTAVVAAGRLIGLGRDEQRQRARSGSGSAGAQDAPGPSLYNAPQESSPEHKGAGHDADRLGIYDGGYFGNYLGAPSFGGNSGIDAAAVSAGEATGAVSNASRYHICRHDYAKIHN